MPKARIALNRPQTRSRERKPQPWEHEERHRQFVRQLPCCRCARRPKSEVAHVRNGSDGALNRTPSDRFAVPLCTVDPPILGCHREQHLIGEETFWDGLGDPLDLAAKLWSLSRKYDGEELIERGRYAVEEWRRR